MPPHLAAHLHFLLLVFFAMSLAAFSSGSKSSRAQSAVSRCLCLLISLLRPVILVGCSLIAAALANYPHFDADAFLTRFRYYVRTCPQMRAGLVSLLTSVARFLPTLQVSFLAASCPLVLLITTTVFILARAHFACRENGRYRTRLLLFQSRFYHKHC